MGAIASHTLPQNELGHFHFALGDVGMGSDFLDLLGFLRSQNASFF
jgi:hypothetical protein